MKAQFRLEVMVELASRQRERGIKVGALISRLTFFLEHHKMKAQFLD